MPSSLARPLARLVTALSCATMLVPASAQAPDSQAASRSAAGAFDARGRLLRNGKPFFVRGWYSDGDPARLRRLAAGGFNAVLDYGMTARPIETTRAYLDEARRLDVAVILCVNDVYPSATYREQLGEWRGNAAILEGVVRAFRDHPAVLAWYQNDELPPEKKDEIAAYSRRIRELDPRRPQLMVHHRPPAMPAFLDAADLFGIDHYPVPQHGPEAVGRLFDEARAAVRARPLWAVLQNFAWYQHKDPEKPIVAGDLATERARLPTAAEWRDGRPPTEAEVRAMAYLALVHGAEGLLFWCLYNLDFLPDRAERWAAACRLGAELRELDPVLLEGERERRAWNDPRIHACVVAHGGRDHILAVNASPDPVRTEIAWRVEGGASVLFEGRTVEVREGTLTDFFAPFARHVYVAARRD
jgi:hypothetical protein